MAWQSIKKRCLDPGTAGFANYGGRGVVMHQAWTDCFEAFLSEVGPAPSARHSIDRVDTEGDYVPGNVRWATWSEQANNRRTNLRITIGGETLTAAEWGAKTGVKPNTIRRRYVAGLSPDLIVAPVGSVRFPPKEYRRVRPKRKTA